MNKPFFYIVFLVLVGFSCQKSDPTGTIDLINVIREGATIPAYIYGNTSSETFIILLHGGPGGTGLEYRGGAHTNQLEENYAMVYTEQRGQGMSSGSFSTDLMTPEELAKDVDALAQSLRLKYGEEISIFLMGHSWGGMLGTQVLIDSDFRKQYKGWIDIAGAHSLPLTFKAGVRKLDTIARQQIEDGGSQSYWNEVLNKINVDTFGVDFDDDFSTVNRQGHMSESQLQEEGVINGLDGQSVFPVLTNVFFVNNSITSFFNGNSASNALFANGLLSYSLSDELDKIDIPTLLLWGKYDSVVSSELGVEAMKNISSNDIEFVLFEQSGHSPMSTEPQAFLDAVVPFIERLR